jgi:hypothetical protein
MLIRWLLDHESTSLDTDPPLVMGRQSCLGRSVA